MRCRNPVISASAMQKGFAHKEERDLVHTEFADLSDDLLSRHPSRVQAVIHKT